MCLSPLSHVTCAGGNNRDGGCNVGFAPWVNPKVHAIDKKWEPAFLKASPRD